MQIFLDSGLHFSSQATPLKKSDSVHSLLGSGSKKILVTGGAGGIGADVAHCLTEVGCSVITVSASQAELDAFIP